MVRTGNYRKKTDPWRRAKRSYFKKPTTTISLYPPIWDSCVFYFNYMQVVSFPGAAAVGKWYPVHYPRTVASFAALSTYFGYYRVEKVTATLALAEIMDSARIEMATSHDEHGFYAVAPDSTTIRKLPDHQQYSFMSVPKKVWRMDTTVLGECNYSEVPDVAEAASINQSVQGGIAVFLTTTTVASTANAYSIAVKYKIRFKGRAAVSL